MAKKMTLEGLARMVAAGFDEMRAEMGVMRGEMATKNEFKDLKEELLATLASKEDLKGLAANWAGEIISLQQIVKDLQIRVAALEGKRGRRG